jgi:hypothetical protein
MEVVLCSKRTPAVGNLAHFNYEDRPAYVVSENAVFRALGTNWCTPANALLFHVRKRMRRRSGQGSRSPVPQCSSMTTCKFMVAKS